MKSVLLATLSAISLACVLSACASSKNNGNNSAMPSQTRTQTSDTTGSANTLSRVDEGIWNYIPDIIKGSVLMQAVILSDGSYWGIYGPLIPNPSDPKAPFRPFGIMHGTANINDSRASGSYTDFSWKATRGTYSGATSAQKNLKLTYNSPANPYIARNLTGTTYNMTYDNIYNQPASLSEIAGTYRPAVMSTGSQELVIAGSTLSIAGACPIGGTITPHGTVNVFDVTLSVRPTCTVTPFTPSTGARGTTFKGILFKTSSGLLRDSIEIIATDGEEHSYFYRGIK